MKRKALAIVLTLVMLVGVLPMGAFAASYTDTEGHWAEKSIDRWTEAKVLEGMGDNTYAPDKHLSRAEAMTIFSRLLKLTEKADISKVTDVEADVWYTPYIETGYAYQIIKGTSDTTFDPLGSITREQFFSIFARAMGIPSAATCDKTFTDMDQISPWAVTEGSVYSMINRGYLDGYPDGSLQPTGKITRAEVAKVLDNAISDYITEDGTYAISGNGIVVVLAKDVKLTGNFNGHIVSSCPDSTLNLSGLSGTPYIYVLGDNTKIVSAKPGTKVAVNPAADNVTANGVKVTNPPYTPEKPYIVPGGGGGGSTPSTKSDKYTAYADITFDTGAPKPHGVQLYTASYTKSAAAEKTLEDIINELCGISGTGNSGYNKNQILSAYEVFYDKVANFKDEATADNGSKYSIEIKDGKIIELKKDGADKDIKDYQDDLTNAFKKHLSTVAVKYGLDANFFASFADAATPANLIDNGTILSKGEEGDFITKYWPQAVAATIQMVKDLQANTSFNGDYSGLFADVLDINMDCKFDSLSKESVSKAGFLTNRDYDNDNEIAYDTQDNVVTEYGTFGIASYEKGYTGAVNLLKESGKLVFVNVADADLSDNNAPQAIAAMMDTLVEDKDGKMVPRVNLNGTLNINVRLVCEYK